MTVFDGYNHGAGTVFKITPDGFFSTLVAFDSSNGHYPVDSPLMQTRNGLFYGMTITGGASNNGVIYNMDLFLILMAVTKPSPTNVAFTWNTITNDSYQLQTKTNWNDANWVPMGPVITATGGAISTTNAANGNFGFFRMQHVP